MTVQSVNANQPMGWATRRACELAPRRWESRLVDEDEDFTGNVRSLPNTTTAVIGVTSPVSPTPLPSPTPSTPVKEQYTLPGLHIPLHLPASQLNGQEERNLETPAKPGSQARQPSHRTDSSEYQLSQPGHREGIWAHAASRVSKTEEPKLSQFPHSLHL
ncbi:hypothetical protein JZ751_010527 [Albula glossodonta]|uniref:Uncharacterized protein n=1 Tax=Albula glossodonta TaxID=121402 RepID=A0A8T2P5J4_9TELE|nr:hypothetical protein JZ751_010527 [Albula glossodonta]